MKEEIIVCDGCCGLGFLVQRGELVNYHSGIHDPDKKIECIRCRGSGRLIKRTKVTTVPYEESSIK